MAQEKLTGVSEETKDVQRSLYEIPTQLIADESEIAVRESEPTATAMTVADAIAEAEKRVEMYKRIRLISLKVTTAEDWINHHDKPYLLDDGANKIARLWGIDIFKIKVWKELTADEDGSFYIYYASGAAYSKTLKGYVEDIGSCSQHDDFFGVAEKKFKPLSKVDETSVAKAAVTNLRQRLVKGVIGLKNIAWDELKDAGLDIEAIKKKAITSKEGAEKQELSFDDETKKTLNEIRMMLRRIAQTTGTPEGELLYGASKFQSKDKVIGARSIEQLTTPKWINRTAANLREIYNSIFNEGSDAKKGVEK